MIVPDIKQGIYPFKGMKLSRTDVEWLLATHENGRGPIDWSDEKSLYERKGLDLRGADLANITSSDEKHISCRIIDINWGDANIAVVNWSVVSLLGDEQKAHQRYGKDGRAKARETRLSEYQVAVRANRQLALALQNQGLNEEAARFAYRAQVLQKTGFRIQLLQSDIATFTQRFFNG